MIIKKEFKYSQTISLNEIRLFQNYFMPEGKRWANISGNENSPERHFCQTTSEVEIKPREQVTLLERHTKSYLRLLIQLSYFSTIDKILCVC